MKKVLKKKFKNSSNAVRYFSTETLVTRIGVVDISDPFSVTFKDCPCK